MHHNHDKQHIFINFMHTREFGRGCVPQNDAHRGWIPRHRPTNANPELAQPLPPTEHAPGFTVMLGAHPTMSTLHERTTRWVGVRW